MTDRQFYQHQQDLLNHHDNPTGNHRQRTSYQQKLHSLRENTINISIAFMKHRE